MPVHHLQKKLMDTTKEIILPQVVKSLSMRACIYRGEKHDEIVERIKGTRFPVTFQELRI